MHKKLYRSRTNQVIGGVCAGIADYFAIDPVIVRVIFVLALLAKGFIIVVYLLLWVLIPEEPLGAIADKKILGKDKGPEPVEVEDKSEKEHMRWRRSSHSGVTGGLILVAIGVVFLVQNFLPDLDFGKLWPVILLAIGLGMLWNTSRKA